jgi:hypothetical protein
MFHQEALLTEVKPKSIYCAECYQRIQQKPIASTLSTLKNLFSFPVLGNDPLLFQSAGTFATGPSIGGPYTSTTCQQTSAAATRRPAICAIG